MRTIFWSSTIEVCMANFILRCEDPVDAAKGRNSRNVMPTALYPWIFLAFSNVSKYTCRIFGSRVVECVKPEARIVKLWWQTLARASVVWYQPKNECLLRERRKMPLRSSLLSLFLWCALLLTFCLDSFVHADKSVNSAFPIGCLRKWLDVHCFLMNK